MTRPLLLLIENSADDVALLEMALRKAGPSVDLEVIEDGQAALDRFHALDQAAGGRYPQLVLLDLKLPGRDGHELLRALRGTGWGRFVPALVLTTSQLPADVDRAYECGANAFLQKPMEFADLIGLAELILRFWLSANRLHGRVR